MWDAIADSADTAVGEEKLGAAWMGRAPMIRKRHADGIQINEGAHPGGAAAAAGKDWLAPVPGAGRTTPGVHGLLPHQDRVSGPIGNLGDAHDRGPVVDHALVGRVISAAPRIAAGTVIIPPRTEKGIRMGDVPGLHRAARGTDVNRD